MQFSVIRREINMKLSLLNIISYDTVAIIDTIYDR